MSDEIPECADEGYLLIVPDAGANCSNNSVYPYNCIASTGSGLHIDSLTVTAFAHQTLTARFRVNRNGNLFVRSKVVTYGFGNGVSWRWCNRDQNGTCQGWDFDDGDVLSGGLWLSSGEWLGGTPAHIDVHA